MSHISEVDDFIRPTRDACLNEHDEDDIEEGRTIKKKRIALRPQERKTVENGMVLETDK